MGFGQTMITATFLVLLTVAVFNANNLISDVDRSYYEKEAIEQAGVLANALISEIIRKKFDSQADTSSYYQSPYEFDRAMGPSSLARNYVNPSGRPDTYPYRSITTVYFDDIDDYNGYIRSANAGSLTGFTLQVRVFYVQQSNPNTVSSIQTYLKKVEVTVTNPTYFSQSLVFSTIVAY